jgi:hypothetical protein
MPLYNDSVDQLDPREDEDLPEQYQMPSLGTRIGAKTPVQPTPDAAQSKVQQTQTPDAPRVQDLQLDAQKLPAGILRPPTPSEIPSPTGSSPTTTTLPALMQRRSELAKPIDPNATDASGKKIYRMGWGQRLIGTAANALNGFARNGAAPVNVGPGATNNRFARETEMQEKNLAATDTDIGNQEKLADSQRKLYDDAVKQAYEGQLGEARMLTANANQGKADAAQQVADIKGQLVDSQNQLNVARANKADTPQEPKTEVEVAMAYQTALMKGDKAGAAKYKGVMDMLTRQKAAGKDTSAADIAKAIQVAEYRGRETDKVNSDKENERTKRYAELDKNVLLKYSPDKMAAEKAKLDAQLETKYAPRMQTVNDQADQMLGLTKAGAKLQTNRPGASTPRQAPKVGDTISVDGKPYRVTGFNPKTKKPIVSPASQ